MEDMKHTEALLGRYIMSDITSILDDAADLTIIRVSFHTDIAML